MPFDHSVLADHCLQQSPTTEKQHTTQQVGTYISHEQINKELLKAFESVALQHSSIFRTNDSKEKITRSIVHAETVLRREPPEDQAAMLEHFFNAFKNGASEFWSRDRNRLITTGRNLCRELNRHLNLAVQQRRKEQRQQLQLINRHSQIAAGQSEASGTSSEQSVDSESEDCSEADEPRTTDANAKTDSAVAQSSSGEDSEDDEGSEGDDSSDTEHSSKESEPGKVGAKVKTDSAVSHQQSIPDRQCRMCSCVLPTRDDLFSHLEKVHRNSKLSHKKRKRDRQVAKGSQENTNGGTDKRIKLMKSQTRHSSGPLEASGDFRNPMIQQA